MRVHWNLEPGLTFLNHGSFGACPIRVLEYQSELRARLERDPVHFFIKALPPLWAEARAHVAEFLGANADDIAFMRNATEGANAVLRSLEFNSGDELLVTSHGYNAVNNTAEFVAARFGAQVVRAQLGFPTTHEEVLATVFSTVTPKTRLAIIDHVTSPTGLVLPIEELVRALEERGIDTFVDGAHGPGMLALNLDRLGAAYYTGNFHKWTCAPKGAAFLHVRKDRQNGLHPAVISHGYNMTWLDNPFRREFDWTGTDDPTPMLCVPTAIEWLGQLANGWPELRTRCRGLLQEGIQKVAAALECETIAPSNMMGFLAAVPLPEGSPEQPASALYADPLASALYTKHRIQVPVVPWPAPPRRLIRISAFLYNEPDEYDALASALREELGQ